MKILVFGSNGLVGNSLRRIFKNNSKFSVEFSTRNTLDLFDFVKTDKFINEYKPDCIINAAAKVGGIYANNTKKTEFLINNLKINLNILESVKNLNKTKVINLGSSCIYPLNAPNPISENSFMTGTLEPTNSPYAMAKLTAIELGRAIKNESNHEIVNLMPTNLYGPNDNFSELDSHVIPGLISRMHKAKKENTLSFKIWGSGQPLREFMHVDDLASSILFIIEKNINDDLINIGSGYEISIINLAKKIKTIVGYEGDLIFDSSKPDGNPRKLLDSELINSLGWKAKIDLDTGLASTYEWYSQNLN
tara:strand:- start:187 stop:1104 length:918 start_codon:yes stop_codon:yes gene_type:complete